MAILGAAAEVGDSGACPVAAGIGAPGVELRDVNCDFSITALDGLDVLLHMAELPQLPLPTGCLEVGEPIG